MRPVRLMMPLAILAATGCGPLDDLGNLIQGSGTSGKSRPAEPEPPIGDDPVTMQDLDGRIFSPTGSGLALHGWSVAAIERDTGIARVGEVDATGNYRLHQVRGDQPQTLVLMSPDSIVQAVLSMPGETPNTIRQYAYFRPGLPDLVTAGPIVTFATLDGVHPTTDVAADNDGDQVPDGALPLHDGSMLLDGLSLEDGVADTDMDGTPNSRDPDIDGDGLANWIDSDDDGDLLIDVLDADQNADYRADAPAEDTTIDRYFREGIAYLHAIIEQHPDAAGTGLDTWLTFSAKLRPGVEPNHVAIRGAPSLLNSATVEEVGVQLPWNRLLDDDGASNDGPAGDGVYAKRIRLEAGKQPRANEAVFVQLSFGPTDAQWFMEFPLTFPRMATAPVSATFDATTRVVTLVGSPFGATTDFAWYVLITDGDGQAAWMSASVGGPTREMTLPENVLSDDRQFEVVAYTQPKIAGQPGYSVFSPRYPVP